MFNLKSSNHGNNGIIKRGIRKRNQAFFVPLRTS